MDNKGPNGDKKLPTTGINGKSQEIVIPNNNYAKNMAHSKAATPVVPVFPPSPPSLLPMKARGEAVDIHTHSISTRQKLKLSIDFPLSRSKSRNNIEIFSSAL